LPDGVGIDVVPAMGGNQSVAPPGFRSVVASGPRYVQLKFKSFPLAAAEHRRTVDVFSATGSDSATTLLIQEVERTTEYLILSLADLQPQLSSAARLRVSTMCGVYWVAACLPCTRKPERRFEEPATNPEPCRLARSPR
jgi:hypothetical protein